jgi:hypothetical protein
VGNNKWVKGGRGNIQLYIQLLNTYDNMNWGKNNMVYGNSKEGKDSRENKGKYKGKEIITHIHGVNITVYNIITWGKYKGITHGYKGRDSSIIYIQRDKGGSTNTYIYIISTYIHIYSNRYYTLKEIKVMEIIGRNITRVIIITRRGMPKLTDNKVSEAQGTIMVLLKWTDNKVTEVESSTLVIPKLTENKVNEDTLPILRSNIINTINGLGCFTGDGLATSQDRTKGNVYGVGVGRQRYNLRNHNNCYRLGCYGDKYYTYHSCYKMGYYGDTYYNNHSCYNLGYYGDTYYNNHSCYNLGYYGDNKHTYYNWYNLFLQLIVTTYVYNHQISVVLDNVHNHYSKIYYYIRATLTTNSNHIIEHINKQYMGHITYPYIQRHHQLMFNQ